MPNSACRSSIVVISWWSNCIGLDCLHRLVEHTRDRDIIVVQVGKSAEQKALFRQYLPTRVVELPYPESAPAEHSRVVYEVALRQLRAESGVWFVDHDVFVHEDCEPWLMAADDWFSQSNLCLCLSAISTGPAITQPAFWLSPTRWPDTITSIDPIPFQAHESARRPDLFRHSGEMRMPVKDTLVQARDDLTAVRRVGYFPLVTEAGADHKLPPFPRHTHLGGLFLFAGPLLPPEFEAWMKTTVLRFTEFFERCPVGWLAIEEPQLLQRLREFQGALNVRFG
jgi:hypothetical protein